MAIRWKMLGANMKAKRAPKAIGHRGLGVRAAARQIGISPATYSRAENGAACDAETFMAICRWLNFNPCEFDTRKWP